MSSSPFNPLGPAHHISKAAGNEENSPAMTRVGVFYATREGHTRHIAERIASDLRNRGFDVDAHCVLRPLVFALDKYSAAVLAASVHRGSHEAEMVSFVKENRTLLEGMPTAFVSVTLSEAGAENPEVPQDQHAQYVSDVDGMLDKFFTETQWHPTRVKPVAGALLYTQYNFFLRFIMKGIARKVGAATDTSRDYDYTDWIALDRFVDEFATEIRTSKKASGQARSAATVGTKGS